MSAHCAAGLSGCAPSHLWRHGHPALIPHVFALAVLRAPLANFAVWCQPQWARCWPVPPLAAPGCAKACHPRCWRWVACMSRRVAHWHGASFDRIPFRTSIVLPPVRALSVSAYRWGTGTCRGQGMCWYSLPAGMPGQPCHLSGQVGPCASLVCRESWRGYGYALGFMTATVR